MDNFISHYNVEITRHSQGSYSNITGKWENGDNEIITTDLCIQPFNGNRLLLPEGVRFKQMITIYSNVELLATNDTLNIKGDVLNYKDNNYTIYSTKDYYNGIYDINYFESIAILNDKEGSY